MNPTSPPVKNRFLPEGSKLTKNPMEVYVRKRPAENRAAEDKGRP
jgi:hypothetical protein